MTNLIVFKKTVIKKSLLGLALLAALYPAATYGMEGLSRLDLLALAAAQTAGITANHEETARDQAAEEEADIDGEAETEDEEFSDQEDRAHAPFIYYCDGKTKDGKNCAYQTERQGDRTRHKIHVDKAGFDLMQKKNADARERAAAQKEKLEVKKARLQLEKEERELKAIKALERAQKKQKRKENKPEAGQAGSSKRAKTPKIEQERALHQQWAQEQAYRNIYTAASLQTHTPPPIVQNFLAPVFFPGYHPAFYPNIPAYPHQQLPPYQPHAAYHANMGNLAPVIDQPAAQPAHPDYLAAQLAPAVQPAPATVLPAAQPATAPKQRRPTPLSLVERIALMRQAIDAERANAQAAAQNFGN